MKAQEAYQIQTTYEESSIANELDILLNKIKEACELGNGVLCIEEITQEETQKNLEALGYYVRREYHGIFIHWDPADIEAWKEYKVYEDAKRERESKELSEYLNRPWWKFW